MPIYLDLLRQFLQQTGNVLFDFGEGFLRTGGIQVMDMPIFDAVFPRGEFFSHQRPMLGLFQGDHPCGAVQILLRQGKRMAMIGRMRNAAMAEAFQCVLGDGSDVDDSAEFDVQGAGIGDPGDVQFFCMNIEDNFRKSAAVVVAGAKKQHNARLNFHGMKII
jgi:hypothetical protein